MYVYDTVDAADISATGALLSLDTDDGDTVSVSVEGSVSSDYALDVNFGDGWVTGWKTYSAVTTVTDTVTAAVREVRVRNTTAQTAGDTADVKLGAT